LALERDGMYRLFDAAERRKLHIRVPLNYEEGCSIEPDYDGTWHARLSDLDRLTTIPLPAARAEAESAPARTKQPALASSSPQVPPAPKKRSRKKTTRGGAQTRRAKAVLDRIFPEDKYRGRYPDEDEMAWPDVWDMFYQEHSRYAKECPSKLKCPSPSTVRRVMGRAE
jgi:hypothetical protein